jgi:hypothetical protein
MLRKKLLIRLCIGIVTLAIVNQVASFLDWYELVWWFDMPVHFLGGISVFYLSAVVWFPALKYVPVWRFIFESVITGLLLGILWEGLELYLHIHYGSPGFVLLDSLSDMTFDLAGILLAAFWTVRLAKQFLPATAPYQKE